MTEWLHFHFSLSCIGEGNGNPLQCSCLENPRDGGAWWAAVYGVTQNQTWLKWLSRSRPVFPAPLVKEIVFAPFYILASFVKDKVSVGAWIYLWAFYFVPLIYIFVFVPVPYCLDDCGFVVEPESGRLIPPVPFFFLKIALAIQGFLYFHTNCEIICSSSAKNTTGSLLGIALNKLIAI